MLRRWTDKNDGVTHLVEVIEGRIAIVYCVFRNVSRTWVPTTMQPATCVQCVSDALSHQRDWT